MGPGIAQEAARAGFLIMLHARSEESASRGINRIRLRLRSEVEQGRMAEEEMRLILSRIGTESGSLVPVVSADLIIEAISEDLAGKKEIFKMLDIICNPKTILATCTSSLSVNDIAGITSRPDRVIGTHFFNPPDKTRLVEIVTTQSTSENTLKVLLDVVSAMNKEVIRVSDTPGFVSSRLGILLGLEAMRMLEEGLATPEEIDKAMVLGYNHPMGPLRVSDLVGLDVRLSVAHSIFERLGLEQFRPPEILKKMVAEGKLGRKTGQGFFKWERK